MADGIILSGASSVGKTTVANDWCSKHKHFVHIQEVARDVMHDCSITRDDLEASLATKEKQVFLKLQHDILEEQNKRELAVPKDCPFISDRGPDPLIFACQYVSCEAADRLAKSLAGEACLERYRNSLVVVLCPLKKPTDDGFRLVPTTCEQHEFTRLLREFLDRYHIPHLYVSEIDHHQRMTLLRKAWKGELSLDSMPHPLNIPFTCTLRDQSSNATSLRTLQFSLDKVQCSFKTFQQGKSNRMIHRFGKDKFILTIFDKKVSSRVVVEILREGLLVNGQEYSFLGCSSSGLRNRTCYLYKGTEKDVRAVLEECGSFSQIKSVSVKLKRIGLLFSEACPTGIVLSDEDITESEDIVKGEFNFTDGCGSLSKQLATRIKNEAKLILEPEEYLPCVFQIRYQGCKGVVMVDPRLKDNEMMIRKSMKKFNPGKQPFQELWLCDHSRPYSYGHLNKQFIMLLSGLGVKDDVFLSKQMEHFKRLELMDIDPTIAVEMLQWNNQPKFAARVAKYSQEELKSDKCLKEELSKLKTKLIEKLEKLHLLVPESRTVFGVCDPFGVLKYGECFFRPTIRGEPCTLSGFVTVAKNPCYLLGDMRRLKAVSDSQRVNQLEHLVDCIVFPTTGKQPHPNEIAGSDLDGDQYFVCWDKDLVIPTTYEPYDYLPSDSKHTLQLKMLEYFSQQNEQSRTMGKIDTYFKYWADKKGIKCKECQELGMHFAHSVDSAKTGFRVNIPPNLVPPKHDKDQDQSVEAKPVWKEMEQAAIREKCKLKESVVHDCIPDAVTEEFVWSLLQDEQLNMSEFQLFNFVKQWCYSQQCSNDEALEKLLAFSDYINFSKFTVEQQITAMDVGVPRLIVTNALNKSQFLTQSMRVHFSMDSPHCGWKFYFRFDSTFFEGHHLLRALQRYPETMVTFQLPNTVTVTLHFLIQIEHGKTRLNAGSVVAYFFSPHFDLSQRCVLGPEYTIELDNEMLQLYRGKKQATFVKLAFEDKERQSHGPSNETVYDQMSVDLTRFKQDILTKVKHPTVRKENFHFIEVFVKSTDQKPAHFDILVADFPGEFSDPILDSVVEEVPFTEEPIEEKELHLESLKSYARDIALAELHTAACSGNAGHYLTILQFIMSNEKEFSHLSSDQQSSLLTLLTTMVARYCHKLSAPDTEDCLQTIVVTLLDSSFRTPQSKLKLLDRLFRLQFSSLANLIVQGIQVSTTQDYFEAVSEWQLWCFLPQDVAQQILNIIKPQWTVETDETSVDTAIEKYTVEFADLLLHQFINEVHEAQNHTLLEGSKADYTIKQLKAQDLNCSCPRSNDGESKSVRSGQNKLAKWTVAFTKKTGLSSTKFTVGTFVMISPMKLPSKMQVPIVMLGHIIQVCRHPTNIVLELEEPISYCLRLSAEQSKGHWQMNLIGNVIAFKRCIKAIKKIFSEKLSSTQLLPFLVQPHQCLTDSMSSNIDATAKSTQQRSGVETTSTQQEEMASSVSKHKSHSKLCSFNESQQRAIDAAISQKITLIHGPPGTGKTHTATEIVRRVYQKYLSSKSKVLVAAETNMAVDNLTRKLLQRNVMVVRVGSIEHMSDDIRQVSLEHQLQIKHLELGKNKVRSNFTDVQAILGAAEVIATTCTGAGSSMLKGLAFPFVLIDEATQATEPVSLVSIVHQCEQLVLIGDPEQLPPTLISSTDRSCTLSKSLFHRLYELCPSFFLEEQHRMHPTIAEFPSKEFYSGRLKSAPDLDKRTSSLDLVWSSTLVFINVKASREQHFGVSYKNLVEAEMVVKVIENLLSKNVNQTEIAVLTPYAGQVMCIREKLGQVTKCVEVCSVDGFQGREKEVIVFSTVRTGMLGFTGDKHRMNVLLTRAKHGIIGIGCYSALSTDPTWASWLKQVQIEESERFLKPMCTISTGTEIPMQHKSQAKVTSSNTMAEGRSRPKDGVNKLCGFIERGCRKGDKCMYAHSQTELDEWIRSMQPKSQAKVTSFNTMAEVRTRPKDGVNQLCRFIERGCRKGDKCRYAHSQTELDEWTHKPRARAYDARLSQRASKKK